MNNDYLQKLYEAYFAKNIYQYFRQQYHILTEDHKEVYLTKVDNNWVNKWIDLYVKYKSTKLWTEHDSVVVSACDCLEEIINGS